jgi:hypothetical protein
VKPLHLTVDASYVYFTANLGGAVMQVAKAGGNPTVLATATQPNFILVDNQSVFWTDGNGVNAVPKGGGTTKQLDYSAWDFFAQNTQSVFYHHAQNTVDGFWRAAKNGIGPTACVSSQLGNPIVGAAVDDAYVYYGLGNQPAYYPYSPYTAQPLAGVTPAFYIWPGGLEGPGSGPLAYDNTGFYYSGYEGIMKLDACTNAREGLVLSLTGITAKLLALDSTYVYWSDGTMIGRTIK